LGPRRDQRGVGEGRAGFDLDERTAGSALAEKLEALNFEVEFAEFDGGVDEVLEFMGLVSVARDVEGFLKEEFADERGELGAILANSIGEVFGGGGGGLKCGGTG
jgi:hypothetical protein